MNAEATSGGRGRNVADASANQIGAQDVFHFTLYLALALWVAHVVTLPVAVSYDGYIYIDLAEVIGSSRFPHDWQVTRTPLYPLVLKAAFAVAGRKPSTAIFVSSAFGLAATLLLTFAARRLLGPLAASIVLVLLSCYPTFVAYQHFVLTETGTAFFLAAVLYLLLWTPESTNHTWIKTASLVAVLSVGYYWRQALLSLAPVAAVLHGASLYTTWVRERQAASALRPGFRGKIVHLCVQVSLIGLVPFQLARPWSNYVDDAASVDTTLRQGILRQALLPPEHPYVGKHQAAYRKAIQESSAKGSFYSGLRSDLHGPLYNMIFSQRMPLPPRQFFLELVRKYPSRYFAGVCRTVILFGGAPALESENRISRQMILSPDWTGAKFSQGPPHLEKQIQKDLQQQTSAGLVLRLLNALIPFYDVFLIYASVVTAIAVVVAFMTRNLTVVTLCAVPLAFLILPALSLASIDRYAFPTYPALLADAIMAPALLWNRPRQAFSTVFRRLAGRMQSPAAPKN